MREEIVAAGLEEFHRLGYSACSVEDITRHAGVPKGSFYNHFKSKQDLAAHVIDEYFAHGPIEVLTDDSTPPLKRLKQYFEILADPFLKSGCHRGCLLANFVIEVSDHNELLQSKLKGMFAQWTRSLAQVIRQGQERGEISTAYKPDTWAGFLLSAYEGTLLRARAAKDPRIMREFEALALGSLAA
jgi:TetR/AcrR family transcriptional regulator, transcriptional repressor for nem operon